MDTGAKKAKDVRWGGEQNIAAKEEIRRTYDGSYRMRIDEKTKIERSRSTLAAAEDNTKEKQTVPAKERLRVKRSISRNIRLPMSQPSG